MERAKRGTFAVRQATGLNGTEWSEGSGRGLPRGGRRLANKICAQKNQKKNLTYRKSVL